MGLIQEGVIPAVKTVWRGPKILEHVNLNNKYNTNERKKKKGENLHHKYN